MALTVKQRKLFGDLQPGEHVLHLDDEEEYLIVGQYLAPRSDTPMLIIERILPDGMKSVTGRLNGIASLNDVIRVEKRERAKRWWQGGRHSGTNTGAVGTRRSRS